MIGIDLKLYIPNHNKREKKTLKRIFDLKSFKIIFQWDLKNKTKTTLNRKFSRKQSNGKAA